MLSRTLPSSSADLSFIVTFDYPKFSDSTITFDAQLLLIIFTPVQICILRSERSRTWSSSYPSFVNKSKKIHGDFMEVNQTVKPKEVKAFDFERVKVK